MNRKKEQPQARWSFRGNLIVARPKAVGRMWLAVCLCSLLCAPAAVRAEGNVHIGQLKIDHFISVDKTWSNNIYYTSSQAKSDSITTWTPGIKLRLPLGRSRAEASYYGVVNKYSAYSAEDTTDNHGSALADIKIGSFFGLAFSYVFDKGHEPRGASATGFIEKFTNKTASGSATYELADRAKLQLDYAASDWKFQTSPFRNRDEGLLSAYFYYRFLPKTSAFVEIDRKDVSFNDPTAGLDNVMTIGYAGLRWDLSEKSQGTVKIGALNKNFATSTTADFNSWAMAIDLKHAFSDSKSLTVVGKRMVNEANVAGVRYLVTKGLFTEYTQQLLRKMSASLRGSYGIDDFSDPLPADTFNRRDKTAMLGLGLKYALREWLEFGVSFSNTTRTSNIPANDYKEHSTMLSANASF